VASLIIGGVLLLAMIGASGRAAVSLPAEARIGVHFGSVEHCYLASKRAGLVIWPAVGAVLFGTVGGITGSSVAANWVPGVRDVLTPAVMCVALAFQIGALVLAGRGSAGMATAGPAGTGPAGTGPARNGEAGAAGRPLPFGSAAYRRHGIGHAWYRKAP
jgi:hypothetical protein